MRNLPRPRLKLPRPPAGLREAGKLLWKRIIAEFDLEDHALAVLELICQAQDRWADARKVLDAEGVITLDRFDQKRAHPAAAVERDSRQAVVRGLRSMGLDLEPVRPPGRPAGR